MRHTLIQLAPDKVGGGTAVNALRESKAAMATVCVCVCAKQVNPLGEQR